MFGILTLNSLEIVDFDLNPVIHITCDLHEVHLLCMLYLHGLCVVAGSAIFQSMCNGRLHYFWTLEKVLLLFVEDKHLDAIGCLSPSGHLVKMPKDRFKAFRQIQRLSVRA